MSAARRLTARVVAVENRIFDRLRSPAAWRAADDPPTGSIESFRGRQHCLLITYRRDGTPVPSPLWFGERDGKLYVHTAGAKVKRIAANPQVRVAPCTFRGKPLAPSLEATARVVPASEDAAAEAAIAANFGIVRRLYYATLGRGQHDLAVHVELTPR